MTVALKGWRKRVNMTLNEALVREVEERRIDLALDAIQEHQKEDGLWGEEFSTI
jgi:hypothetical protein